MGIGLDGWVGPAVVIVLSALAIDRTRAYRALPAVLSRLRARSRSGGRREAAGVDSGELPPVGINRAEFADREKEPRHGEGN